MGGMENWSMRIIFMGTPFFAVSSLSRLIESRHDVALVVTQPDRKAGRGQKMQAPPVKELALSEGIPVIQPGSVRDPEVQSQLAAVRPHAIVVVAYGKILPPAVLNLPQLGCVNVHASLLPKYRGAAPVNWAIINGEARTGVTIMRMDEGMDTGDIIAQATEDILADDDAVSVAQDLSVVGADLLVKVLDAAEEKGAIEGEAQDDALATYAPLLKKGDGLIDWSKTTEQIICLIRGTRPWPGAFTPMPDGPFKIVQGEPLWSDVVEDIQKPEKIAPGTVTLTLKSHGFAVRTGDGFLLVTEAQPPGRRAMSGVDMVNGGHVKQGEVLGETLDG